MTKPSFLAFASLLALSFGLGPAHGESIQATGNAWQLCDQATARVESAEAVPSRLLKAISLAETGRWDRQTQANFAWPWTVTALGEGHYFSGPEAALNFIRRLQGRGIRNIDVGCMQVNLFYHGSAFASLEDAIDPATNVAYAAQYLKGLYRTTRSWTQAAAWYHSTTPKLARAYKLKVMKYWNGERRLANLVGPGDIDYTRMQRLNTRFAARGKDPARQQSQLDGWRDERSGGHDMATLAAMRRAAQETDRRRKYLGDKSERAPEILAAKRRAQLDKWRLTRISRKATTGG
ncbi:MAG: transglycosylase SLT domain-containing protein [Alphaproteobacteria bacterium]